METDSLSSNSSSDSEDDNTFSHGKLEELQKSLSSYICTSLGNCSDEKCSMSMIHPHSIKLQQKLNVDGSIGNLEITTFRQFHYVWKVLTENGQEIDDNLQDFVKGLSFSSNESDLVLKDSYAKLLEKEYNNPSVNIVNISETPLIQVDFDKFLIHLLDQKPIISYSLKRLTTPPKLMASRNINAMGWTWYWKPGHDWKEMNIAGGSQDPLEQSFLLKEKAKSLNLILDSRSIVNVEIDLELMVATIVEGGVPSNNKKKKDNESPTIPVLRRPTNFSRFVEWTVENVMMERTGVWPPELAPISGIIAGSSREWVTFGDLHQNGELRFPTNSEELEEHFLKGEKQIEIKNLKIDFTEMKLLDTTVDGQTEWRIKREEICKDGLVDMHSVPVNWDPMPKRRIYVAPIVPKDTEEWDQVNEIYTKSLVGEILTYPFKIDYIRRIQNPWIFSIYEETKNQNKNLQEMHLFHGTRDFNIGLICEQNFNPELSKNNPEVWFATTAAYSFRFCTTIATSRNPQNPYLPQTIHSAKMFLCKVLVPKQEVMPDSSPEPSITPTTSSTQRRTFGLGPSPVVAVAAPDNRISSFQDSQRFVSRFPRSYYPEYILYLK